MNILQAAFLVVRDIYIQQGFHVLLPPLGDIGHFQRPPNDVSFDAITHNDVQWISEFVGFHTDQRWRYRIDGFVDLPGRDAFKLGGERLLQFRKGPVPKGQAQSDMALPEQRLRFVSSHGESRV